MQARCSKGPCKHKSLVVKKFKLKNFEVLPKDNPEMRSVYYYLATGENKDPAWFRPIEEEESAVPLVDWEENIEITQEDQISDDSIEHIWMLMKTHKSVLKAMSSTLTTLVMCCLNLKKVSLIFL